MDLAKLLSKSEHLFDNWPSGRPDGLAEPTRLSSWPTVDSVCAHCPRAQPGPPNRRPVRQFTWFLFLRASIYGARCCRKKCSRVRQPGPAQHHEGLQRRGQSQEPGGAPESSDLRNAAGVKQETCWLVPTALPVLRPRGWAQSWPRGDTGGCFHYLRA